jgi:hypothetical protein
VFKKTQNNNVRKILYYLDNHIKMKDLGGTCGIYGGEERCMLGLVGKIEG